jgi:hypothetical protein
MMDHIELQLELAVDLEVYSSSIHFSNNSPLF